MERLLLKRCKNQNPGERARFQLICISNEEPESGGEIGVMRRGGGVKRDVMEEMERKKEKWSRDGVKERSVANKEREKEYKQTGNESHKTNARTGDTVRKTRREEEEI